MGTSGDAGAGASVGASGFERLPSMRPAGFDETESRLFVHGIAMIMYWRLVGEFRARVRYRNGVEGSPEDCFILEAKPRELVYTLLTDRLELVERFDGYAHIIERDGDTETFGAHNLTPESHIARLAFPLSLSIWDRTTDDFRFTGAAEAEGEEIRLALVNRFTPDVTGVLTVNTRLRMVVSRETPTQLLAYEEIDWV